MAIDLEWQDERGGCLVRYSGPPIGLWIFENAPSDSVSLRFIDPYGDTIFNSRQIPVLEQELLSLAETASEPAVKALLAALIDFVRSIQDRTHRYLKFIGD